MSGEGKWVSITTIRWAEIAEFLQLAAYGEVKIRARRVKGKIHDPAALQQAEDAAQARRDAEASQQNDAGIPPIYIGPPWINKKALPVIDLIDEDVEIPAEKFCDLGPHHDVWRTGIIDLRYFDPSDDRVRLLFRGVEFWKEIEEPPSPGCDGASAGNRCATDSEPSNEEVMEWMEQHRKTNGGSCDWKRSGPAFKARFPHAHFDREYILQLATELGFKRRYGQDK